MFLLNDSQYARFLVLLVPIHARGAGFEPEEGYVAFFEGRLRPMLGIVQQALPHKLECITGDKKKWQNILHAWRVYLQEFVEHVVSRM